VRSGKKFSLLLWVGSGKGRETCFKATFGGRGDCVHPRRAEGTGRIITQENNHITKLNKPSYKKRELHKKRINEAGYVKKEGKKNNKQKKTPTKQKGEKQLGSRLGLVFRKKNLRIEKGDDA